jgi:hypothetical protein
VLFGIHFLVFRAMNNVIQLSQNLLFNIYGFLFLLTLVHFISLKWLFGKWPRQAGFIFAGMSMLKMLVAVLFLFPFIYPANQNSIPLALNFVSVYLLFLAFEVVFLIKSLMKNH